VLEEDTFHIINNNHHHTTMEEDTLLSFSAGTFITLAEETGNKAVVFIGHYYYSSLGIYEDKI
jgi:hypothetical protein